MNKRSCTSRARGGLVIVALVFTLIAGVALAACGGDDDPEDSGLRSPATPMTPETALPPNVPECTDATLGAQRADEAGLAGDCDTLLAIKSALAGQTGELNWSVATPIASWNGVTVSGEPKRVTRLRLWEQRLTGVLPTQLGNLTALAELVIYDNPLTGVIPTQLGNLTALTHLSLSTGGLTGSIPTQLGNLTALDHLCLRQNALTGHIPTQLGELATLTELCLDGNDLVGTVPPDLGNLTDLRSMRLHSNNLSGPLPTQLEALEALEQLTVAGNSFTGCVPGGLRDVPDNDLAALELPDC